MTGLATPGGIIANVFLCAVAVLMSLSMLSEFGDAFDTPLPISLPGAGPAIVSSNSWSGSSHFKVDSLC